MKKLTLALIVLSSVVLSSIVLSSAFATPVLLSDTENYGVTWVVDNDWCADPSDNTPFAIDFDFGCQGDECDGIVSGIFSITHYGSDDSDDGLEEWNLTTDGGNDIGTLSASGGADGWVTDFFTLTDLVLAEFEASDFTGLTVILDETTDKWDGIYLANASANFVCDASPVPEPASILLLGFGLLGLSSVGRKRVKA